MQPDSVSHTRMPFTASANKSHIIIPVTKRDINNAVCRFRDTGIQTHSPTKQSAFSRRQFLKSQTAKRALTFGEPVPPVASSTELPYSGNVHSKFNRILELPFETHRLDNQELLKICSVAEEYLQKETQGVMHLSKKTMQIARSLQLDFSKKEFSILCKTTSCFKTIKGSAKEITPVIVVPHEEKARADFVRISNRTGKSISKLECDLLIYFAKKRQERGLDIGEIRSVYIDPIHDKQSIVQHREECLLSLGPDAEGIKITEQALIEILKDISEDILAMHTGQMCHGDLKLENILYKRQEDGIYRAGVTDFGLTFIATSSPSHGTQSYGTREYTAPETLEHPLIFGNGKAKDMYAIGYMIHELLWGEPEWGSALASYFPDMKYQEREKILRSQHACIENFRTLSETNPLVAIMIRLLDPNPESRMTAMELSLTLSYM